MTRLTRILLVFVVLFSIFVCTVYADKPERLGKQTGQAKQAGPNGPKQGQEKVQMCKHPGTDKQHQITVAAPAVDAQLSTGAIIGSCPTLPVEPPNTGGTEPVNPTTTEPEKVRVIYHIHGAMDTPYECPGC